MQSYRGCAALNSDITMVVNKCIHGIVDFIPFMTPSLFLQLSTFTQPPFNNSIITLYIINANKLDNNKKLNPSIKKGLMPAKSSSYFVI